MTIRPPEYVVGMLTLLDLLGEIIEHPDQVAELLPGVTTDEALLGMEALGGAIRDSAKRSSHGVVTATPPKAGRSR